MVPPSLGSINSIHLVLDEILDVSNYTSHECKLEIKISGIVYVISLLNTQKGTRDNSSGGNFMLKYPDRYQSINSDFKGVQTYVAKEN